MGQWEKAGSCLNKKMQILDKIAANTEAQCRFIYRREMKGLKRALREKEVLIGKLAAVNEELARDQTWKSIQGLAIRLEDITRKQKEIIERSHQVLQEAVNERIRIAAELRSSKAWRQVRNQYVNPWTIMVQGRRINEKG